MFICSRDSVMRSLCWLTLFCLILAQVGCAAALIPAGIATTGVITSQERPVSRNLGDKAIVAKINGLFVRYDINNILANVNVDVFDGRVLLTGTVPMQMYSDKAVEIAWKARGVKGVLNEIMVDANNESTSVSDSWILGKIWTKLLAEKSVYSANYLVQVNHGTVYLLGVAQNEEELERVLYIASRTSGVGTVVNYVTLKSDPRRNAE